MTGVVSPGNVSFSALRDAADSTNPVSLSQYYAGSALVSNYFSPTAAGDFGSIPAVGPISIGSFRNKFLFKFTWPNNGTTGWTEMNVNSFCVANGWNPATQTLIAIFTVAPGAILVSNTGGVAAFDTGTNYPKGATIRLINNGTIIGKGGAGGAGGFGTVGGNGGPGSRAITASVPLIITNNGTIAGGGGGGGGGGGFVGKLTAGGAGGGGGRAGGLAGASNPETTAASPGNNVAPGAGGVASNGAGNGGAGGNLATAGSPGATASFAGGAGGAPGPCTVGIGNITWVITGTRLGALT